MSDTVTIGVAIAVPEPHAAVLAGWRQKVGDPSAGMVFPHVTLLPPTPVAAASLGEVEAHLAAAAVEVDAFAMHLAGAGTFRPVSSVVFAQVATGVSQCELLERAVRRGMLARELDFPYHPHVTVAHDIDDAALDEAYEGLAGFSARFPVTSFVLYCRDEQGAWSRHREFALGAGPAAAGRTEA